MDRMKYIRLFEEELQMPEPAGLWKQTISIEFKFKTAYKKYPLFENFDPVEFEKYVKRLEEVGVLEYYRDDNSIEFIHPRSLTDHPDGGRPIPIKTPSEKAISDTYWFIRESAVQKIKSEQGKKAIMPYNWLKSPHEQLRPFDREARWWINRASSETVEKFAKSSYPIARAIAAISKKCNIDTLIELSQDEIPLVRNIANENPNLPGDISGWAINADAW